MSRPVSVRVFLLISLSSAAVFQSAGRAENEAVRFDRDVRTILADKCYACHGPDDADRQADLRLDRREGIESVFGERELTDNEAWLRVTSDDPDTRMPPVDSSKELSAEEIDVLRRWIEQGATWEGHWSFQPPRLPEVPRARDAAQARNPIDAFVIARLETHGLELSPEADRERLLRRVTFDLTGLPPTIEEIDDFVGDRDSDAYEKVVDRLLASRHYGERMALAWMDAARYGDSSVFHADGPRDMWPWRDWVIRAYNANLPFDRFTIEQLAGDLLPDATVEQRIATGFNRNNATTDEGGAIAEEYRVEYAVDRVKTTSMVWLGLTMECAQCHSHKYDPISQEDYYRFYAYFNQASDPGMQTRNGNQAPVADVPDRNNAARLTACGLELEELRARLERRATESEEDYNRWLADAQKHPDAVDSVPDDALHHFALDEGSGAEASDSVDPARKAAVKGNTLWAEGKHGGAFRCDGGNHVELTDVGDFESSDAFSYGAWIHPKGKGSGAPLARMDDGSAHRGYDLYLADGRVAVHLIHSWPGNAIKVVTKQTLQADRWQHVLATYDGSGRASGVTIYVDGEPREWDIEVDKLNGSIRTDKPLNIGRRSPGSPFRGLVDDVRVFGRALTETEVGALFGSDPIGPILAMAPGERTDQQRSVLREHFLRAIDEPYRELHRRISEKQAEYAELSQPIGTVMVMKDLPSPRMTYVLDRGDYASPRKDRAVAPGTPGFLPSPTDDSPPNRLGLARWIARPDHPLTARVAVNRYWYMLFGTGIVSTVEDFGSQGEAPSHPELLDWLATDFVSGGWDVKRTIKQMVMSATYRQTSRVTRELWERDPENRLLARGPRFRLQGEFVRDNALAASGLLVPRVGGPSVKPYQPPGLWNEVSLSGNVRFVQDKGENLYRRGMYTYWKRSAPAPSMTIFDAPSREKCVLRRSRTNTPLQALVTLNDVQFVEAARALAGRSMLEGGEDLKGRIVRAYRLAAGVTPRASVVEQLEETYNDELRRLRDDPDRAAKILSHGQSPRDESLDAAEHAAMTIVATIILNLDETLTRG